MKITTLNSFKPYSQISFKKNNQAKENKNTESSVPTTFPSNETTFKSSKINNIMSEKELDEYVAMRVYTIA